MKVPFVDLKAQYAAIKDDVQKAINRVLENTSFILGSEVEAFEGALADFLEVGHAIGVSSGTAALHLALKACGVKPGDEVITAANTFIATAEAIVYLGATPVFADVDPETQTLDVGQVEALITPRTKAIVPVHLFGHPADMDPILDLAKAHGLMVVEDACQAHGAEYGGRRAGGLGHVGCFSFYPGKNLGAYGDGGVAVTNDPALAEDIRMTRNHGRAEKYEHLAVGYNYRLDALQAAILGVKLERLEQWNAARREHAQAYSAKLAGLNAVTPVEKPWAKHVYHIYQTQIENRDAVAAKLKAQGIATGVHYPIPLHLQPVFADLGQGRGTFPVAERLADRMLSLPMFPELTDEQISHVCDCLGEAVG